MVSTYCTGIDANIATWGQCIMETAFFGDPLIMGVMMYLLFGLAIYSFGLPGIFALPVGMLLSVAMYIMSPTSTYFAIMIVAALLNFAAVAFTLYHRFVVS